MPIIYLSDEYNLRIVYLSIFLTASFHSEFKAAEQYQIANLTVSSSLLIFRLSLIFYTIQPVDYILKPIPISSVRLA